MSKCASYTATVWGEASETRQHALPFLLSATNNTHTSHWVPTLSYLNPDCYGLACCRGVIVLTAGVPCLGGFERPQSRHLKAAGLACCRGVIVLTAGVPYLVVSLMVFRRARAASYYLVSCKRQKEIVPSR